MYFSQAYAITIKKNRKTKPLTSSLKRLLPQVTQYFPNYGHAPFDEPTIDFVLLSAFPTTPEMSTMIIPREARCDQGAVIVHDMHDIFEGSLDTSSIPRCEIDFHFRAE